MYFENFGISRNIQLHCLKSFPSLYFLAVLSCFQIPENNTETSGKRFPLFKNVEKIVFKHLIFFSNVLSSMDSSTEAINSLEMEEAKLYK